MKPTSTARAALLAAALLLGGCVSTTEFYEYKQEMETYKQQMNDRLEIVIQAYVQADRALANVDDVLLCESRVDAYAGTVGSDEVDPTRRDEPSGTRRDLEDCQAELEDVTNGNLPSCSAEITQCYENSNNTAQQCRVCAAKCLNNGSWPNTECPLN